MSQKVVCVFAHPDDEAFGPGGTIAKYAKDSEVYLISATNGNSEERGGEKLGKTREKELLASAKVLGIKKVFFLGFEDGTLDLNTYHNLADKIRDIIVDIRPETVITFELRGISGHPDHVVVAGATSFVVQKLPFVKNLYYHCLTKDMRKRMGNDYFIFVPPGYSKKDIDKVVDVSSVWETKVKAMRCHKSQIKDVERILESRKDMPKKEYFLKADL